MKELENDVNPYSDVLRLSEAGEDQLIDNRSSSAARSSSTARYLVEPASPPADGTTDRVVSGCAARSTPSRR